MISRYKAVWLVLLTAMTVALVAGCNDSLRQFILPVPQPGGDPCAVCLAHAMVLSTNPAAGGQGSAMHIDVLGDTNVGIVSIGTGPVFVGKNNNRVFVTNSDNTVDSYIGLVPTATNPSIVTLPATSTTPIAGAASSTGNYYLANSGSGTVSEISSGSLAVIATVPVGTQPVAVVGSPNNSKIYVVNHGSNNVTVISTTDNTVTGSIAVGTAPVWGVMSNDGSHVYIVNQGSGTVSAIDTLLDIVIATIPVGTSPNFAFFDVKNQRVWVSNTGSSNVSVLKANDIDLAAVPQVLPRLLATVTLTSAPTSVTVLADGTRAYAALGGCPAGTNHTNIQANLAACTGNLVSEVDGIALKEVKTITVGPGAVAIDSSTDSSRVYAISSNDTTVVRDNVHAPNCTANCLPGAVLPDRTFATPSLSIVRTATDTVFQPPTDPSVVSLVPSFSAPQQDFKCVAAIDPTFNSKVPLPCPIQKPFMVRMLP